MLVQSASMREYFRESLDLALRRRSLKLSETAQAYVVNLLAEFGRAETVFAGTDRGDKPRLVDLLTRAVEADPQEALRIYKHMGDSSLYFSGYFVEAVEREAVGVDYYVSMGGTAYASVADLMRPVAATSSALFAELSDRFRALVDLLASMSLHGSAEKKKLDDRTVLALVERYRRTGAPEIRAELSAAGITLPDDDPAAN